MSVDVRRAYRKRTMTTRDEWEVLSRYAEKYTQARSDGVPRNLTRQVVEEARGELRKVSTRDWDDPLKERYEIRQWFNRWNKARQREESGRAECRSGQITEVEVEVESNVAVEACVGERWTNMSRPPDGPVEMRVLQVELGWWEGPWEPLFEEDMLGLYYDDWVVL
jgi:hypothetical protein